MLPVVLKGAPFSTLGGGGGAPFCALSIPPLYSAEKPHVFRKATKEVAFRNTCGFWTRIVI